MSTASVPDDVAPPPLPRGAVRHRRTLLVAALGVGLLAGCAGTDAGTEGPGTAGPGTGGSGTGGSGGTEDLPAPYGDALTFSGSADSLCHVPTNQVADIYVSGPDPTDPRPDHRVVRASGPANGARAHAATAPAPRTLVPPDEGVVEEVAVEVVSVPDDPILELEITLTGPEQDHPYLTESVSISFLTEGDDQRWVGFAANDGELTRNVPLDEPITPSPDGTSTRLEVVPVACPDAGEDATAVPLADGAYEMSIFGVAEAAETADEDSEGLTVWGQERTPVTVTDAVVEGIGYSGPNAYGR